VTRALAWWINRRTEITTVLAVSKLEELDKQNCYDIDKVILTKLLQGYKIPDIKQVSVDEVYARGKRKQKEHETRDDLSLTIITDINSDRVIWVASSRRKGALDEFFNLIGVEACKKIKVVAIDQHEGYGAAVRQYCPNASLPEFRLSFT
jgi:hypothetical protein